MVRAENISYTLKSGRKILDNVSFSLKKGEICGIIGPNGAGKTTLMKIVAGVLKASSGSVYVGGCSVASMKRNETARRIAYLPQTAHAVPCSVYESVLIGRKPYMTWHPKAEDHCMAEDVIGELDIGHMREKCVTELSGGEFQKTLIARALVQNADVLMLDEPINHLDVKNQVEIMETAKNITERRNLATIIVLHDLNLAVRYADRILLLENGSTLYFGGKNEISEEHLSTAYKIPIAIRNINEKSFVLY
ncbi:ABC transporter ATP-binding protein [Geovibrio thiophilus]|uniref:ABC transporter ATP-binding protein n=1 Tax=Geovibrio thiophilus TaxID=139438 RepID=A0A410JY80_9BACT|nr:ABC transporter ATP-binding protein [Geovibrio thiophilus]QAR33114.1 ABC transporter ATP-binding protein [Geovibrio thiophilus]